VDHDLAERGKRRQRSGGEGEVPLAVVEEDLGGRGGDAGVAVAAQDEIMSPSPSTSTKRHTVYLRERLTMDTGSPAVVAAK